VQLACVDKHHFHHEDAKIAKTLYGWTLVNEREFVLLQAATLCRVNSVVTVGRRDAAVERTGTYSQRVTEVFTRHEAA
jgi:hypothetical protein